MHYIKAINSQLSLSLGINLTTLTWRKELQLDFAALFILAALIINLASVTAEGNEQSEDNLPIFAIVRKKK